MSDEFAGSMLEIQMLTELINSKKLTQRQLGERTSATRAWVSKHQERIENYGFVAIEIERAEASGWPAMHYRITDQRRARAYVRRLAKQFCRRYCLDEAVMPRLLAAGRLSESESRAISTAIDKVLAKR